jgi:hypothetical protein
MVSLKSGPGAEIEVVTIRHLIAKISTIIA